ncbi:MAG: formate/nitrite transporter family protein [Bacilli bacterium]
MKEIGKTLLLSILAGILIGIGCSVNLLLINENKYLGAFLFSAGLFFICELGFKLFTGAIGYALSNNLKNNLLLFIILVGNAIGCFITFIIVRFTRIYDVLKVNAQALINLKLNDTWYSILLLSILCGILIYLGVETYKKSTNNLAKILGIVFCVMIFILLSAEHCIANIAYFFIAGSYTLKGFSYFLLMVLGNSIGGLLIPIIILIVNKLTKKEG